jgi:hypothetical protein
MSEHRNPLFGEPWDAPCADEGIIVRVSTPVGDPCLWCEEPIRDGDRGFLQSCVHEINPTKWSWEPIHAECSTRMIVGSIGHLDGQCSCFGGKGEGDPPGLTKREAALLVWRRFGLDRRSRPPAIRARPQSAQAPEDRSEEDDADGEVDRPHHAGR